MVSVIRKPKGKEWPDPLELKVYGTPIRIEYKNQNILIPDVSKDKADNLARYLLDEGLVEIV